MSDTDGAGTKAPPLRVPVLDVPVRHSIVAPDQMDQPARAAEERPSVVPQPVRVVTGPPPANASSDRPSAVTPGIDAVPKAPAVPAVPDRPAAFGYSLSHDEVPEPVLSAPRKAAAPGERPERPTTPFDPSSRPERPTNRLPSSSRPPRETAELPPVVDVEVDEDPELDAPGIAEVLVSAEQVSEVAAAPATEPTLAPVTLPDVDLEEDFEDEEEPPRIMDASDTLELEPDDAEEEMPQEPTPRPSAALPPPPPAAASHPPAPPSAPAPSARNIDIDVTEEEEADAVVIDLTRDDSDPVSATSVPPLDDEPLASVPPAPAVPAAPATPPSTRRSQATPPPPPSGLGPSGASAHRVADLKPSKPRKQAWWESFFNDDYLRSVRAPGREAVARKADFIQQRLGLSPGAAVLDVGCGWGAEVVELSSRGYLGVGLDLSLAMLSRAADEAQERGQRINFLHADMREMNFDGTFDAVMCLGTTFGYFDDDTNKQVISRLRRALKPQGVLLLETVNRDHVIRSQPNLVWFEGDGCVCMEESEFNYFTSRLHVKRTVILDDGRQRENEYSVRLYSLHEIGQMLHQQGFRVTEVSGRMTVPGVFFGQESPSIMVVAERRADALSQMPIGPLDDAFEEDDD